ncbi:probable protein phosphatase 2C 28, partial [Juglans regia]|uniref:Probable protein phosphatase 2C 28 n=1 Tax=Juglans regia TaxID=51240 RepID=A0A6P9EA30_JUGRE
HGGSIDDADYDNEEFEARHGTSIEDTEDSDDGDPISQHLSHGFYLIKGKMDHQMEDNLVAETREVNGHELGLYAIFDGHSGRYVAKYLQSHLFDKILSEPNFWTNPKHSIKTAYEVTDDEILGRVGSRGGSTAVTAILIDRETLIVANVGDSRAILCRNGVVKQITIDHEPTKEKQLVESRGGFVSEKPVKRSICIIMNTGFGCVQNEGFSSGVWVNQCSSFKTGLPRFTKVDSTLFELFRTTVNVCLKYNYLDKVMSNQEAFDCIGELNDAQKASEKLIEEVLCRKSYDDISCIVVMLRQR